MTRVANPSPGLGDRSRKFFTGAFSREFFLKRLVPFMYGFLFGCFLAADLIFPPKPDGSPGYVPFTRTISGQGNHGDNPVGAWFFVIGLVGTSIILVPFNLYAWRRLSAACKNTAGLALFFAITGAAGFAVVGIWDEQSTCLLLDGAGSCTLMSCDVHDVGSAIAFGGNLLAVLVNLFPMISHRVKTGKDDFGAWWQLAHVAAFVALLAAGLLVMNGSGVPPFFKRSAFWQWSLFTALAVYYLSLSLRLPGSVPKPSTFAGAG
ncbi:MAG: hypothetical protein JW839_19935 [Candidatus Lokiarchaeota archaeon]|nr:hypothetical protein [Candidatus Lokiarchaeota archaeon]